jgi:hypothetical protein
MPRERESSFQPGLPPEMAEFLKTQDLAAFWWSTNFGTSMVIKAPRAEIDSVRGTVPIHLAHSLYDHPQAPLIRSTMQIIDQPDSHLALETYTNVADPQQRSDFARLARQRQIRLLFYDEALTNQLIKVIQSGKPEDIRQILQLADELHRRIPVDQFDFDAAKAAVLAATRL